eukprot:2637527-Prymnesium_polylepis.1
MQRPDVSSADAARTARSARPLHNVTWHETVTVNGGSHLEAIVIRGTDGTQSEQLERGHDAGKRDRAGRDRIVELRVQLIVIAVHPR